MSSTDSLGERFAFFFPVNGVGVHLQVDAFHTDPCSEQRQLYVNAFYTNHVVRVKLIKHTERRAVRMETEPGKRGSDEGRVGFLGPWIQSAREVSATQPKLIQTSLLFPVRLG